MNQGGGVIAGRAMGNAARMPTARALIGRAASLPASRVALAMTRESVLAGGKDRSAPSAAMVPGLRKGRNCRDGRSAPTVWRGPSVLNSWNNRNRTVGQSGSSDRNDARDLLSLSSLNVPSHLSAFSVGTAQSSKNDQLGQNDLSDWSNQTSQSGPIAGSADSAQINLSAQPCRPLRPQNLPRPPPRPRRLGWHHEIRHRREDRDCGNAAANPSASRHRKILNARTGTVAIARQTRTLRLLVRELRKTCRPSDALMGRPAMNVASQTG
jgi:hypothetical protein